MSEDVGSIYIEIELEVRRLLDGVDQVNRRLNSLPGAANNASSSFNRTERSAGTLNTGLSKLAATIGAVITASALKEMAGMVQKHQEFAERVRMATSSQAEFNEVQERLLKTANGTFRALSEAQELYITTADSLRSMGYTTNQAIDIQDSMSYAFVKNATSADRASTAISAFSKSINTGKVGAEQWETITSAIPSVINDIATASGKSSAQVRALGAAGKLTAKDLTEGLKQSLEANETAATGMANTLVDATVRMNTAITSLLVEVENGTGVLKAFTSGIISAADSMLSFSQDSKGVASAVDTGTTALTAMAVVLGARVAGAMAAAGKAKLSYIAASANQLKADLASAKASEAAAVQEQRRAAADVRNAQLDRARLQNTINNNAAARQSAIMSAELTAARQREIAANVRLNQANSALTASTAATGAAARAASVGMRAASGALSLMGGPVGVVMIAAAGLYYWWQQAKQAREEALAFADSLDKLKESMVSMNNTQLRGTIADTTTALEGQEDQASILRKEIASLTAEQNDYTERGKKYNTTAEQGNGLLQKAATIANDLAKKKRDLADVEQKINDTTKVQNEARRRLTDNMLQAMGITDNLTEKSSLLAGAQTLVAKAFNDSAASIEKANQASQNFNPKSLEISPATADGDKIILNLEEQNELLKIKDERLRAVTRAEMEMAKVSQNSNQITNAGRLAGENYDLQKSQEKLSESHSTTSKTSDDAAQSLSRQQAQLDRLNTGYAEGSLELAKYDAVQALGVNASAQQKTAAEAQAASIWEVQRAVKAAADEEQKRQQAAQNFTGLQSQASPVLAADNQFQQQMTQLNEYALLYPQKIAEVEAARAAIEEQYRKQRMDAQWQELSQMGLGYDMLTSAVDAFSGNASNAITGLMTGTMSAQDAMRSLGNTILNSAVNSVVQLGVEMLKNFILSQTLGAAGAAASIAAATASGAAALSAWTPAAIAASIATLGAASGTGLAAYSSAQASGIALSVLGGRKNGGPVSGGGLYQVGEGNLPEFLKTRQGLFMIPGDNGQVFSNKDVNGNPTIPKASTGLERMQQSSEGSSKSSSSNNAAAVVNIVIENNGTPQQIVSQQREQSLTGQDVIRIITQDANEKGPILQSIMANTSATARLR